MTSKTLVDELRLSVAGGFGANANNIAALTGAYVADGSAYLQSAGFALDQRGRILTALSSSEAIGRLPPDDVAGLVEYVTHTRCHGGGRADAMRTSQAEVEVGYVRATDLSHVASCAERAAADLALTLHW